MTKKQLFWVGALLLHIAAFIWAITHTVSLKDSNEYWNAAFNFSKNGTFYCYDLDQPLDYRGFTKRPALYPLFLWILGKKWLVLLFQNGLSLLNIFLAIRIFTTSEFNKISTKNFVLLLSITVFSFSQFIYANLVMADLFLQTLTILGVHYLIKGWQNLTPKTVIALLLVVIFAILTKPVATFWIYALPIAVLWMTIHQKKRIGKIALFTLLAFVPILVHQGVSIKNKELTGLKHFSSISDINLLHYNTRYLLINKYGDAGKADEILAPLMAATPDKNTFVENTLAIRKACKDLILDNKWRYIKIHTLGALRMLVDPGRFDLYQFLKVDADDKSGLMEKSMKSNGGLISYVKKQPMVLLFTLLLVLCFNLIKLFYFVKFTFNKNEKSATRIIVLAAVLYFVGITGPIGASRFLLPVLPFFIFAILGSKNVPAKEIA